MAGDPDRLPPVDLAKPPEVILADARRRISYLLVGTYLFLLLVNVGLPVALYLTSGPHQAFSLTDLKDLSSEISGVLASLVGILGFVVGYYFKSIDDESKGDNGQKPASGRSKKTSR